MPIPLAFMFAAQAAGMVIDYLGRAKSQQLSEEGLAKQHNAIQRVIACTQVQTEDESLRAMIALRKNLGTQAAMFAARGVRSGTSTTALFSNESVSSFNTDERMRRLNQAMNESRLEAGLDVANIRQKQFENENWNAFSKSIINKIPTDPKAYEGLAESFGFKKAQTPTKGYK